MSSIIQKYVSEKFPMSCSTSEPISSNDGKKSRDQENGTRNMTLRGSHKRDMIVAKTSCVGKMVEKEKRDKPNFDMY